MRHLLEKANIDLRVSEKKPMYNRETQKPNFPAPPSHNVNSSREDDSPEDNMAVRCVYVKGGAHVLYFHLHLEFLL